MKILFPHVFLITIMATLAITGSAWAQDAGMSDVEMVNESDLIDSERMLYSPGEAEVRYIPKAASTSARDSVAIRVVEARTTPAGNPKAEPPAAKSNKKRPAKEEDDSILSFNFLYYIIQKYKLQDIID